MIEWLVTTQLPALIVAAYLFAGYLFGCFLSDHTAACGGAPLGIAEGVWMVLLWPVYSLVLCIVFGYFNTRSLVNKIRRRRAHWFIWGEKK